MRVARQLAGTSVGLDLKTGRVHCLACQRSVQPEGLTQSNEVRGVTGNTLGIRERRLDSALPCVSHLFYPTQAVRAAWQMLRSGMTPGAPANDPAPEASKAIAEHSA